MIFRTPRDSDDVSRLIWKRIYPDDYKALHNRTGRYDPFAELPKLSEEKLTPRHFGILDWDRGIIPQAFAEMGFPCTNGAIALYDHKHCRLTVVHSRAALDAFRKLFPEFKPINSKPADANGSSATQSPPNH